MQVLPLKFFTVSTRYPESGNRLQLGSSYQFDTPPDAPDQRTFVLKLRGMKYFVDSNDQIDTIYQPELNLAVLEQFYNDHKRAIPFYFNHPVYGQVVCKFQRPLEIPEGIPGGMGAVSDMDLELIEIP